VSSKPAFAPRALLQIFIKTTPHHRLRSFVALSFTHSASRYYYAFGSQKSFFGLLVNTAAVHISDELPLYLLGKVLTQFQCASYP
jgi:hypothetical protein